VIVVNGNQPGRIETERNARDEADRRERERREAFDRQRQQNGTKDPNSKPTSPTAPAAPALDEQQRLARAEEAVARRQALDAAQNQPAKQVVPDGGVESASAPLRPRPGRRP